jgi:hypothetical protein
MISAVIDRAGKSAEQPGRKFGPPAKMPAPPIALMMSVALVISIVIVATAVSIGFASAQTLSAMSEPDTGLVLALLACAIGVMGVLSALAVRFAGRPRQR